MMERVALACMAIAYVGVIVWFGIVHPPIDYVYQGYGEFDYDTAMQIAQIAAEHEGNAVVVQNNNDGSWAVTYNWTCRTQGLYGLEGKEDRWPQYFVLGMGVFGGLGGVGLVEWARDKRQKEE